jgi:hypothetical protein
MSSIYQGVASNVSTGTTATINGATNATPIVVSTTAAHGYQTGDIVDVASVGGNTAANNSPNNPWTITVVDATHFSLNGSTGSGAYTAGGTSTNHSLTPATTIPSDGDARNAASVNVPLETALDRTEFLASRLGKYRLINQYLKQTTDDTFAAWSTNAALNTGAWVSLASADPMFTFTNPAPVCSTGDVFDISFTTTGSPTGVSEAVAPAVGFGVELGGGAATLIVGCGQKLSHNTVNTPICLRGLFVVPSGTNQTFNFAIMGLGNNVSPPALNLIGHRMLIVNHWRPN